jgi:uncharacterized membrane protein YeaQ/YmgE (transglycosylase-associated protein family)
MKLLKWIIIGMILGVIVYLAYDTYREYQTTQQIHAEASAQARAIAAKSQQVPQRTVERTQQIVRSNAMKICRQGEPCTDSGPERIIERIVEREVCAEKDSSLEFDAVIVKLKMQNESSWMAIVKLLVAMLLGIIGIKFINMIFARLEVKK